MRHIPCAVLLALSASAQPTTWWVDVNAAGPGNGTTGSPFTSIQAGINAATAGDTVMVRPGLYVENLDFLGKGIAVRSVNGPLSTFIDGNQSGTCVTFASNEPSTARLEGFWIQNGRGAVGTGLNPNGFGRAGGIQITTASPTIVRCLVMGNFGGDGGSTGGIISGSGGVGGIGIEFGSPTIRDSIVAWNTGGDGAFFFLGYAGSGGTGGVGGWESTFTMSGCTVSRNDGGAVGGTIGGFPGTSGVTSATVSVPNPAIHNTIVWDNPVQPGAFEIAGSISWTTCVLPTVPALGAGTIVADPQFVGPFDLHIGVGSPCIDAGSNGLAATVEDIDAEPRIMGGTVDIGADEFPAGLLHPAAGGDVGAPTGGPFDVLLVNGSAGNLVREVTVGAGQALTLDVTLPPGVPVGANFVIWATAGIPGPNDVTTVPWGVTCFRPAHLSPADPGLFVVANNFWPDPLANFPSAGAPWTVTVPAPLVPTVATIQGLIQQAPGLPPLAITNAIAIRVQ